jgi:entry exclusion lipoprotein TrbK
MGDTNMIATKSKNFILLIGLIILLNGCSDESTTPDITKPLPVMPEVNDKNCEDKNVALISDKKLREEFVGLCIRRGSFKASPKKAW